MVVVLAHLEVVGVHPRDGTGPRALAVVGTARHPGDWKEQERKVDQVEKEAIRMSGLKPTSSPVALNEKIENPMKDDLDFLTSL